MTRFALRAVEPTEAQIQNAVIRYLEAEPLVGEVLRQNSGAATAEHVNKQGERRRRFVAFVRDSQGNVATVLDIRGAIRGTGRLFEMEAKLKLPRPETIERWRQKAVVGALKKDSKELRFIRQLQRIEHLRSIGCLAGFVTCVEDARAIVRGG